MGKFGKKFSLEDSSIVGATDAILDAKPAQSEQSRVVEQPVVVAPAPVVDNTPAQVRKSVPAVQVVQDPPTPYNEVLKNVGAKIPYSVYDRLERIKRQSERTGIRSEKRNIGDLIAQAVKEFVEKYDV